jgi:hypothetical protein
MSQNSDSKAQLSIYRAIPKIMLEMEAVSKEKTNKDQGYKFRGIEDVYKALQKIMAKHSVFTSPHIVSVEEINVVSSRGNKGVRVKVRYEYFFFCEDGSFITADSIGEGIDYGDKAYNKAASIAHKYALLQVFCIPTEDIEDPDKESHDIIEPKKQVVSAMPKKEAPKQDSNLVTEPQLKRLFAIMNAKQWVREDFDLLCEQMGFKVSSSKELTKDQYNSICEAIEQDKKPIPF